MTSLLRPLKAVKSFRLRLRRQGAQARIIAETSLFDRDWYLRTYPDVASGRVDALIHYLTFGWREGRDPGPEFGTNSYLEANPDVARSGINPLVHYIEFGRAEGRGMFGHRSDHTLAPDPIEFERSAPCVSFDLVREGRRRWTRSYRIDESRADCARIGEIAVGYSDAKAKRKQLEDAADSLAQISGLAPRRREIKDADRASLSHRLADSWYVNDGQLRTRWTSEKWPFVVRVLQHDPGGGARVCLVGEGLISSRLDVLDVVFTNPLYPLLFIFCEPDGTILDQWIFAFPSLSRGGAHYAEMIAGTPAGGPVDVAARSDSLATNLFRIATGKATAMVRQIAVELDGADGRGLIFQEDFRDWLRNVARVGIRSLGDQGGTVDTYLTEAIALDGPQAVGAGGTLALHHDMVPTIAALTEPLRGSAFPESLPPMLLSSMDATSAKCLVDLPSDIPSTFDVDLLPPWPRLSRAGGVTSIASFPPAAIRTFSPRPLSDAEILVPVADEDGDCASGHNRTSGITWLLEARDWEPEQLNPAIECLALQLDSSADHLSIVGKVDPAVTSKAMQRFERTRLFADLHSAAVEANTPLVGFLGGGILLQDPRTASRLSKLLSLMEVETASCPIIHVEKRGRGWHNQALNIGTLLGGSALALDGDNEQFIVRHFWRSIFPVVGPTDLWLARRDRLCGWLDSGRRPEAVQGFHLCSFEVTASSLVRLTKGGRRAGVPPARPERATRLEMFPG